MDPDNPVLWLATGAGEYVGGQLAAGILGHPPGPPSLNDIKVAISDAVNDIEKYFLTELTDQLQTLVANELTSKAESVTQTLSLYHASFVQGSVFNQTSLADAFQTAGEGKQLAKLHPELVKLVATFITLEIDVVSSQARSAHDCGFAIAYAAFLAQDCNWLEQAIGNHVHNLSVANRIGPEVGCKVLGDGSGGFHANQIIACWFEQDGKVLGQNRGEDVWNGDQNRADTLKAEVEEIRQQRMIDVAKFQADTDATWGKDMRDIVASFRATADKLARCKLGVSTQEELLKPDA